MQKAVLLTVIAALGLGACGRINVNLRNPAQFLGSGAETTLPYRANLRVARDGDLTVSVRAEGASLDQVRESARYPVTRHCIERHGTSAADWEVDASGDWAYQRDTNGNMTLRARCRT